MTKAVIQNLQQAFAAVSDVRSASTVPPNSLVYQPYEADLVVSTWMGAQLYVYVLESVPKVRDVRHVLKENSRASVGTLFMVRHDLLPRDDQVVTLPDWQEALVALHDDFIYTVELHAEGCAIHQVHFTPSNTSDEYRCWHLRDFTIENVSVRSREVHAGVRGKYAIGDIASSSYKRRMNEERVHQRYHYRTKYTHHIPGSGAYARSSSTPPSKITRAYALLGLDENADAASIKAAFRQRAMQLHPDVSALPRPEAHRRFQELNEAYDTIKTHQGWT